SERASAAGIAAAIAGVKVALRKRATETGALYGSVTAGEIVDSLATHGVEVDRRQVDLAGGIKSLGDHLVRIDLHSEVVAELAVTVEAEE
ncbi:MAG TPA: 50S ribosomal protein L9, partial [Thermoanaerobaculia bacterium]|nr:50S ribosomal protein L9 [Thermoanaerobaculia bacterium]